MVRKILKTIFILGYIFYGAFGLYSIGNLLIRNEIFSLFTFEETTPIEIYVSSYEKNDLKVKYIYQASDKILEDSIIIYSKSYEEKLAKNDIKVMYNTSRRTVSYLKNAKLVNEYYIGLYFSLFWLFVIIIVDKYADKDVWIARYRKAFD